MLRKYRFDFVLGSLHAIRGMDDFAYVDFSGLNAEVILERYFDELLELCQWGGFDSLAHMTYPLRYIVGKYQQPVEMSRYSEVIREILSTLAQKHLGLEINTAGLRREIGQTSPTLEYVKLFRELGGEILTFGSDAHCAQDLGAGLETAIDMAKEAGFSYFAFYKKHEPQHAALTVTKLSNLFGGLLMQTHLTAPSYPNVAMVQADDYSQQTIERAGSARLRRAGNFSGAVPGQKCPGQAQPADAPPPRGGHHHPPAGDAGSHPPLQRWGQSSRHRRLPGGL